MLKGIRFLQAGRETRPVLATGLAVAAALFVAACGDEDGGPGGSPAALVPADAALYLEAVVKPEGEQREEVESALQQLLQTDDLGQFVADLDVFSHTGGVDFDEIEPLLGERLALFVGREGETGSEPPIAGIAESDDPQALLDRVRDSIEGEASEAQHQEATIHLVADEALAATDDYLIAGSEQGVRDALDAQAGESFAESETYADEVEELRDGSVAAFYAEPGALLDLVVSSGEITAAQGRALDSPATLGVDPEQPMSGKLEIDEDSFKLAMEGGAIDGVSAAASDLIQSIPAESWLGFAVADAGAGFELGLESARAQEKAFGPAGGLEQFERALDDLVGPRFDELLDGIGDVAFHIGGGSIFDLSGAIVVETSGEDVAKTLVDTARNALSSQPAVRLGELRIEGEGFSLQPRSAPVPFSIAQRGNKVVAGGLGDEAVQDAFEPEEPFADTDRYQEITGELGDGMGLSFFLDFASMQELLGSIPGVGDDPDLQAAEPYLDQLELLALGTAHEGDRIRGNLVLTLRDTE